MLSPFECLCGNFILPEPASYVFFYAFSNLRNLLYIIHRQEAVAVGGFKEFNIFDMRENRMEYEANIFASQASLPDDTILEYIENGYDIQQIARAMCSDINLIALKVDTLIAQGYQLRKQEHQNDFLKYNHKM